MTKIDRPRPVKTDSRGHPCYSGEDLAAYRLLNGLTQEDVASRMRVRQSLIANYEAGERRGFTLMESTALPIFDAIDAIAETRRRLVAEGQARLAGAAPSRVVGVKGYRKGASR